MHSERARSDGAESSRARPRVCFCFLREQFGAFCPLFRLHGDRSPELINECGRTGSPNEVWHYGDEAYASIVKVMKLRESFPGLRKFGDRTVFRPRKVSLPLATKNNNNNNNNNIKITTLCLAVGIPHPHSGPALIFKTCDLDTAF